MSDSGLVANRVSNSCQNSFEYTNITYTEKIRLTFYIYF